nr:acyltransferase family protein [Gilvimarinus xylanilyticus]
MRAIAVLSVILFHLEFVLFSGGFIGVDVFFVISGYLITAHIRTAVTQGYFSFKWFYAKRARRLLPAMLLTLVATLVVAWFVLPASNLERLAKENIFALFSVSNVLFWSESGYFDTASTLKPLLHTWSLSVEEQFYLFWPLLLCFVKKERSVFLLLVGLGLISLVAAQLWVEQHPELVFYMMPFRITEFAFGGVLVWLVGKGTVKALLGEVLTFLGLVAVIVPVFMFDESTLFPGVMAVIPCVGTALVIAYGGQARVAALLRWSPIVYIGLISYSLYLNHWPLIVIYKHVAHQFAVADKLWLLAASAALAVVMYHFVETPFRRKTTIISKRFFAPLATGTALAVLGASVWTLVQDGFPERHARTQLLESDIEAGKQRRFQLVSADCRERGWSECKMPSANREQNVLIIGDSHTVDAYNILRTAYPERYYVNKSLGGCPPTVGGTLYDIWAGWSKLQECDQLNQERLAPEFLRQFDTVVIAVYWGRYQPEHLSETLRYLEKEADLDVVVFGNFLALHKPMPDLFNLGVDPREAPDTVKSFALFEDKLQALSSQQPYRFVSKQLLLCADEDLRSCQMDYSGELFSYDDHHMSYEAAVKAGQVLRERAPTWDDFLQH